MSKSTTPVDAVNLSTSAPTATPATQPHPAEPACLTAALAYLRNGWCPVWLCPHDHSGRLPDSHRRECTRPGKRPVGPWKHLQTTLPTEDEVRAEFWENPHYNLGVVLGEVSHLASVDVDNAEGEAQLLRLAGGAVPDTLRFETSPGKYHLLYRLPAGFKSRTTTFATGGSPLHIQGKGSLSVMPGSVHYTGALYHWTRGSDNELSLLADAPPWLLAALAPQPQRVRKKAGKDDQGGPRDRARAYVLARARACLKTTYSAVSGNRGHDRCFQAACMLVHGFGLDRGEALLLLLTEYNERGEEKWSMKELEHKVDDAIAKGSFKDMLAAAPPAPAAPGARPGAAPAAPPEASTVGRNGRNGAVTPGIAAGGTVTGMPAAIAGTAATAAAAPAAPSGPRPNPPRVNSNYCELGHDGVETPRSSASGVPAAPDPAAAAPAAPGRAPRRSPSVALVDDHDDHEPGRAAPATPSPSASVPVSSIEVEEIKWLWRGWMPEARLVVLEAIKGNGKSTFATAVVAAVTAGLPLPGRRDKHTIDVLWVTAEEDPASEIAPRLIAAGADVGRVHMYGWNTEGECKRDLVLPRDLLALRAEIIRTNAKLVILDPFSGFLDRDFNENSQQDMRAVLQPLYHLAKQTGATILLIRHLRKGKGGGAIDQGIGSVAIGATARAVLRLDKVPGSKFKRALSRVAGNNGRDPDTLTFEIVGEGKSHRVEWCGTLPLDAEELAADQGDAGERSQHAAAKRFLRAELAAGPVPTKEIRAKGEASMFSVRTLWRAGTEIGVKTRQRTVDGVRRWEWYLPGAGEAEKK